jgi:hypothetical protein
MLQNIGEKCAKIRLEKNSTYEFVKASRCFQGFYCASARSRLDNFESIIRVFLEIFRIVGSVAKEQLIVISAQIKRHKENDRRLK